LKKFVAGVVVGFAASCVVAFASSTASHDGAFWNKLTRTAKNGYVNGYTDAMRFSVSKLDTMTTAGDLFHWKGSRKIIHEVKTQLSMSELAPEDAVNGLDQLYKSQTYSELELGAALQLLALRALANSAETSSGNRSSRKSISRWGPPPSCSMVPVGHDKR
jgi:hypothetical protein